MGVDLRELTSPEEITLESLNGRVISIDAMNAIYQFLAIIRQPDGTPLKDTQGRVTSHLSGLFYRTINFIEKGILPVYVYDGKPPDLKAATISERQQTRREMEQKWQYALREGDLASARKFAQGASRLTSKMTDESKELLAAMGIPIVQAPSEGEGQASFMVKKGDAWACGSQDYDALLYGAPRLVRNLTSRTRRKIPKQNRYITIHPEVIESASILQQHSLSQAQLVDLGILLGTDYNDRIPGIGPKTALKLISTHGSIETILAKIDKKFPDHTPPIDAIRAIFLKPPVTKDYDLTPKGINPEKIQEILCEEHQFSLSRVDSGIQRMTNVNVKKQQTALSDYFG